MQDRQMVKISIIVPVYNVEKYLDKCLRSLVKQTLEDIEIIAVNDGATDGSAKILQRYAERYAKLKVLNKENGGLSDARNYGLKYASGEYIGFVDADDYVDEDMFELLYSKACEGGYDITECNFKYTYGSREDIEYGVRYTENKEILMYGRCVVWNKIYNRKWLQKTGVCFKKGIRYEDLDFFIRLVPHIRSYAYIDEAPVHYVQHKDSISHKADLKTLDIIKVLKNISAYYKKYGFFKEYEKELEYFCTRILLMSSFFRICRIKSARDRYFALKKSYDFLIKNYPDYRKGYYLKRQKSAKAVYLRSVNSFTCPVYAVIFAAAVRLEDRFRRFKP